MISKILKEKKLFLFRSEFFIEKTVKVSTEITNRIFSIPIVGKIRLIHVEFLTADKTSFDFFFAHVKTLKKVKKK